MKYLLQNFGKDDEDNDAGHHWHNLLLQPFAQTQEQADWHRDGNNHRDNQRNNRRYGNHDSPLCLGDGNARYPACAAQKQLSLH